MSSTSLNHYAYLSWLQWWHIRVSSRLDMVPGQVKTSQWHTHEQVRVVARKRPSVACVANYDCNKRPSVIQHLPGVVSDYVRISSSVNTSVSEGKEFKLTCKGDVSNYDSIIWEIQSGDKIQTVECASCITTNKSIATSVLSVNLATQDWNGEWTWFVLATKAMKSLHQTIYSISSPANHWDAWPWVINYIYVCVCIFIYVCIYI